MTRVLLMAALATVVALVTMAIQQRRGVAAPTEIGNLPSHLDRSLFDRPNARWLLLVFSADSCLACAEVIDWVRGVESTDVAVQVAEVDRDAELHAQHKIDSVPSTLLVDNRGAVTVGLLGPLSATGKAEILEVTSGQDR